jgi:hypothetical protein
MPPGIYPYLGGSVSVDQLRALVTAHGGAVVPEKGGVRLAAKVQGVWVDPAQYGSPAKDAPNCIFDCDEWLERQRAAGVPVILTDTPRIRNRDRSALRKALARWDMIDEPTLVVLPLESWWLKGGLSCLTEEVRAAGRPVALVLLHHYNGLDAAGAISGLLTFTSAIGGLPVVLLRCDISAIGAVAYGAFAGFIGWSAATRHGPMPIRRPERDDGDDGERDESPAVFVPALHDYFKASRLPAFARGGRRDVLRCDEPACGDSGLLRIARVSDVDLAAARAQAYHHNVGSAERIARRVLTSQEPRDAWWETCKAGAAVAASLAGNGITVPVSRWLRQWLEMGSPAHDPETVG